MKTAIKLLVLVLAAFTAVKVFYYLTEKRQAGVMPDEDSAEIPYQVGSHGPPAPGLQKLAGGYAVKLPVNIQEQAGIRLTTLEPAPYRREIHASGQVIDIQPLLDQRLRYHEIQGEQRIAENGQVVARQDYERLQQLHREAANISTRELQQARLQMQTRETEVKAAAVKLEDLRQQFIQGWGQEIADLFLGDTDLFRELSLRKSVLLLVTVTGGKAMVPGTQTIFINALGDRAAAEEAYFISAAAGTDPRTQSLTYFFHAPVSTLRTGMNVDAWIPEGGETQQGFFVPAEAVVWYADRPWIYVARDKEIFARIALRDYTVTRQGWFVTAGLHPGDQIVTAGPQMLLSQEFRWSIPDEDNNP